MKEEQIRHLEEAWQSHKVAVTANTQYTTNIESQATLIGHPKSPASNVACPHCKLIFKVANLLPQSESALKRQRELAKELEGLKAELSAMIMQAENVEESVSSIDSRGKPPLPTQNKPAPQIQSTRLVSHRTNDLPSQLQAIDMQTLSARAEELIFQDVKGTTFQIIQRADLHDVVLAHQNNKVLDDVSEP